MREFCVSDSPSTTRLVDHHLLSYNTEQENGDGVVAMFVASCVEPVG
jgi:hypothetical protein